MWRGRCAAAGSRHRRHTPHLSGSQRASVSLLGLLPRPRRRGLASITGPVLRPADAGYAAEIAAFNPAVTRRPGIVVGAESEDDVVAAVAGAGADGLPVGVKGAGHGTTADPAAPVLLSTRRLDAVTSTRGPARPASGPAPPGRRSSPPPPRTA